MLTEIFTDRLFGALILKKFSKQDKYSRRQYREYDRSTAHGKEFKFISFEGPHIVRFHVRIPTDDIDIGKTKIKL